MGASQVAAIWVQSQLNAEERLEPGADPAARRSAASRRRVPPSIWRETRSEATRTPYRECLPDALALPERHAPAPSVDLRPQLHFHPARLAAIELLVGLDGIPDRLVLGEELARIDRARPHQLHELRQVRAVVAVAHPHDEVLVHRQADGER